MNPYSIESTTDNDQTSCASVYPGFEHSIALAEICTKPPEFQLQSLPKTSLYFRAAMETVSCCSETQPPEPADGELGDSEEREVEDMIQRTHFP